MKCSINEGNVQQILKKLKNCLHSPNERAIILTVSPLFKTSVSVPDPCITISPIRVVCKKFE